MEGREKSKYLSKLLDNTSATNYLLLPEYDLLAALLATGVSEAAGHNLGDCRSSYKKRKIMQTEAQKWIDSDEIFICEKSGISFGYICEALSLNQNAIRSALRSGKIQKTFATYFRNREQKGRVKSVRKSLN